MVGGKFAPQDLTATGEAHFLLSTRPHVRQCGEYITLGLISSSQQVCEVIVI